MSDHEVPPGNADLPTEEEEEENEDEDVPDDFGEGGTIAETRVRRAEFTGEAGEKEWVDAGEFGEGGQFFIYRPTGEGSEQASIWEKKEGSVTSIESEAEAEIEETEEEKELRREREGLIEEVRQKILDRMLLRRKNAFLHKKLMEHFKKRRMENVFKEEPKGLDLEKKYLKRLHAFQEFKQAQEKEIEELTVSLGQFETDTNLLKEELDEKVKNFMARAKEVSLNLILTKTGKKLSEKTVDRLLRRQAKKNEEKGIKKLRYIKIRNLIEEKERQLKEMEYVGEGLYVGDYEQMKIDNQNLTDKIEEKEDELTKMRLKTQAIMQNLSQVREKAYAIEGDIELMVEKVYAVEKQFVEVSKRLEKIKKEEEGHISRSFFQTRKRLTKARKKRDFLRDELTRLKLSSGLLSNDALLRDFEANIYEAKSLSKTLEGIKKLMHEKTIQEQKLNKAVMTNSEIVLPKDFRTPSKIIKINY